MPGVLPEGARPIIAAMTLRLAAIALFALGTVVNGQAPMLTAAEKAEGWKLMFDGKSLDGGRG